MKAVLNLVFAAGLCALAAAPSAGADAPKKGKAVESKAEKAPPSAASVNFSEGLGLSLDSLGTIGARIDAARAANDPVALAGLAKELAATEEVASKKAGLSAKELTDEAVKMAKLRDRPDELRAVAKMVGGEASDELRAEADKTAKADEQRQKTRSSGTEKGIAGDLIVNNDTPNYVKVYVNDDYVGTVRPYGRGVVTVGDSLLDTTYLHAETVNGIWVWNASVPEVAVDYTWTLTR